VSLLTDVSSEMIYPLLPVFLASTLGASASAVGAIEGAAESTSALLKLASGWWSDRVARRKPLVVAGYLLSSTVRPLVALTGSPAGVLGVRLLDRLGKGVRSSPRDALIADSVPESVRGRAFGFHRAADHLGAVIGPLVAYALLRWAGMPLRTVFLLAAVPAAAAVVVLVLAVREGTRDAGPPRDHDAGPAPGDANRSDAARTIPTRAVTGELDEATLPDGGAPETPGAAARLGTPFWAYLGSVLLFTLGNSTDAFLLLRATELGVPVALLPVLWAAFHVVKSASSTPGGALSDRVGRRPLIVAGWLLFAAVYFAFGRAGAAWQAWALFGVYGLVFGLTEGTEKALVADLAPRERRGAAFGWYNLAVGLGALPASVLFGVVWDRFGAAAAFTLGASLALAAALALGIAVPSQRVTREAGTAP
jgi:MFS family permease